MKKSHLLTPLFLTPSFFAPLFAASLLSHSPAAEAKASSEQISQLGNELTCVGAQAAGNADGSIPPFNGQWLGIPDGVEFTPYEGQHPVDPYPQDKPLFVINGHNWQQYESKLTEGQKAMFKRYPKTFSMPIYSGRRDFRYPDFVCDIARKNAQEAELIDQGMGFTGYKGAIPFPIPDTNQPLQVLQNHNFPYRAYTYHTVRDIADVNSKGYITWGRQNYRGLNVTNHPQEIGKPMEGVMAYSLTATELPARSKGSATVTSEPVNFAEANRLAWNYNPGTRRVRQLPEYGFDTPLSGTAGKLTIDSDRLMNGSPERYDWIVQGKKEIYIPANAYRVHSSEVKYDDLLQLGHANPDYMRYELRRVWVLEAKLKEGYRHRYGKRVMYLDEDTWHGVIADYYDTRDTLVQHAFINYFYAFDINAWQAGSSFYHDLTSGGYVGYNLFQEQEKAPVLNRHQYTKDNFSPAALRRLSH